MPVTVTSKGRIKLKKDGLLISEHVQETEAFESAIRHAEANGSGKYVIEFPIRELDVSVLARTVLLLPPTNATASPVSSTRIDLSWTGVVGALEYNVYRDGVLVQTTNGTTFSDTGLTAGTLYSYQLSTIDLLENEGPKGSTFTATTQVNDTTPPTAPTITVSTFSSSAQTVSLSVASTDTGSGVRDYTLQRATNSTFTTNLVSQTVATSGFPVGVSGLTASTTYFYRCRAMDNANNVGSFSATVSATTQAASNQPPEWASSADQFLPANVAFSLNLDTLCSDPESQPLTYTIVSGTLPTGLAQSGSRGQTISGTPTVASTFDVTFRANDVSGSVSADWTTRSRASGVFYANNLSEKRQSNGTFTADPYADSAALRAASFTNTQHTVGEKEVLLNTDSTFALSGGKSLEIKTFDTSTADHGGGWMDRYKSDGSFVNGFYFQFCVYLQRDALAWRLPQTNGQMKVLNLEQFGGGQVVVMAAFNLGFPTLLLNGSGANERFLASVPYKTGGDWFYQTAIDSGSSLAAGTRQAYLRRYGPGREIYNNLYSYGYVSGNASANLLYNRGFAWPDADAIQAGAVPYNMDGWTVVEVYINNTDFSGAVEAFDVVKMWVAPYGSAPTLVCDLNDTPNDDPQSIGSAISGYQTFEALWYDTAFGGATQDIGYRPLQRRFFTEFIGSSQPIQFPGGFSLP